MAFVESGIGRSRYPKESGSYVCVIISRDGKPVLRILHFDNSVEFSERWIRAEIDEYGYFTHSTVNADFIHSFQKIDGVTIGFVPEEMTLKIDGVSLDDDE